MQRSQKQLTSTRPSEMTSPMDQRISQLNLDTKRNNQKVNALYDTGAGYSLINYSMYEELGMDVDKGYQPTVKSSTGEDVEALGQVTFTFKINNTPFTQSFIVCRHMTRHMILGTDFTATNFVGVIWTREGT